MGAIPPEVRAAVLARDRRCVASLFWPHICRNTFGAIHPATDVRQLELDHLREHSAMGLTATSVPEHLVALCSYAHQASGWATSNRDALRIYVALAGRLRRVDRRRLRHIELTAPLHP